jgi:hypothetical protein
MKTPRLFIGAMLLLVVTSCVAQADRPPFDEVVWTERAKPDVSLLYVVLTDTGGYTNKVSLVVSHASAALSEAAKHQGHDFNVVFLVRTSAIARSGSCTGFSVEQLREITSAAPAKAEELVSKHAWSIGDLSK